MSVSILAFYKWIFITITIKEKSRPTLNYDYITVDVPLIKTHIFFLFLPGAKETSISTFPKKKLCFTQDLKKRPLD